ncbi:MAG: hypothetical protein LBC82_01065 [Oscillospiraceae bacterium]|nr:hypothetical protein [Oscillospiraceae bacterium]
MKLKKLLAVLVACMMVAGFATMTTLTASADDDILIISPWSFGGGYVMGSGLTVGQAYTLEVEIFADEGYNGGIRVRYADTEETNDSLTAPGNADLEGALDGTNEKTFDAVPANFLAGTLPEDEVSLLTINFTYEPFSNDEFTSNSVGIFGYWGSDQYEVLGMRLLSGGNQIAAIGTLAPEPAVPNLMDEDLVISAWSWGGAFINNDLFEVGKSYKIVFEVYFDEGTNGGLRVRYADYTPGDVNLAANNADLDGALDGTNGTAFTAVPANFLNTDGRDDSTLEFTIDFTFNPFSNVEFAPNSIGIFGYWGAENYEVLSLTVFDAAGNVLASTEEDEEAPDFGAEEPGDGEEEHECDDDCDHGDGDEEAEGDDDDTNPKGGVALAVVPALVAVAALAASRKRK